MAQAVLADPVDDPASEVLVDLAPALARVLDSADLAPERPVFYPWVAERLLQLDVRLLARPSAAEVPDSATKRPKKAR